MKKLLLKEVAQLPDSAALIDVHSLSPSAGEVLVNIDFASINPADLLHAVGWYAYPAVVGADLGIEGTGHVSAVGAGVSNDMVGKRVILLPTGEQGAWADQVVVAEGNVVVVPEGDPQQLAQLAVNPLTAYVVLHDYAQLEPGDWIGLTLANSAVGRFVIQLAKLSGFRTLSVVRSDESAASVRALGGDAVVVSGEGLAEKVKEALAGEELKLVIDGEGGATVATLASALRSGGTVVAFSSITAEPQQIQFGDLLFRDIKLRGFYTVNWLRSVSRERLESVYTELARLTASGDIHGEIADTFDLTDFGAALARASEPGRPGKVLLRANASS